MPAQRLLSLKRDMGDSDFQIFQKEVSALSYTEAYGRWTVYLDSKQQDEPDRFPKMLNRFLEQYPFSFIHWIKYLAHCTQDLGKAYQVALEHMPKSTKLWRLYLDYLHDQKNPALYKKQLERAILQIGADINSYNIFEEYYVLLTEDLHKWEFFKKLFPRALIGLEKFMEKFIDWINNVPADKLQIIYAKEIRGATGGHCVNQQQFLKGQAERQFKKAIEYRDKRIEIEDKIKHFDFDGEDPQRVAEYDLWKEYINLSRSQGVVENVSYCYERALACQTEQLELWEEAFHYLQNETGKYDRVLNILRSNKTFFIHFNPQLYFYWCDLEERLNPKTSRQMYVLLEEVYKSETPQPNHVEVYFRHIQFELRDNQLANAKTLYDTLLLLYQGDLELLSFIVVEYADFFFRKYKDLDYPKRLLKTYFEALPYNDYLFTNYLEFSKNFENIDGYYDQLMTIVAMGLSKAKKSESEKQYLRVVSLVKNYLRSSLSSIYLIKMSEKKMIDIGERLKRGQSSE